MQGEHAPEQDRRVRVVVDDSVPLRETLVAALAGHPNLEVVATAGDGTEAVRVVREVQPDVVLLDLRLGDCWGLDLVPVLRGGAHVPAVVVFSASDVVTLETTLGSGAQAQVAKGAPVVEIARVLVDAAAAAGQAGAGQS